MPARATQNRSSTHPRRSSGRLVLRAQIDDLSAFCVRRGVCARVITVGAAGGRIRRADADVRLDCFAHFDPPVRVAAADVLLTTAVCHHLTGADTGIGEEPRAVVHEIVDQLATVQAAPTAEWAGRRAATLRGVESS